MRLTVTNKRERESKDETNVLDSARRKKCTQKERQVNYLCSPSHDFVKRFELTIYTVNMFSL